MSEPKETIAFAGRIGEVVHIEQPDGRIFERYRRSPGTRLIIVSPENKILMNREFRHETGKVDLRLPGGKVCDSLEEYDRLRASSTDMLDAAIVGGTKEGLEETGLILRNLALVALVNAGATVEWDLYYLMTRDYDEHEAGPQFEQGEDVEVEGAVWLSPDEIRAAIANDEMEEWRSVGVLLGKVLPELEA